MFISYSHASWRWGDQAQIRLFLSSHEPGKREEWSANAAPEEANKNDELWYRKYTSPCYYCDKRFVLQLWERAILLSRVRNLQMQTFSSLFPRQGYKLPISQKSEPHALFLSLLRMCWTFRCCWKSLSRKLWTFVLWLTLILLQILKFLWTMTL